MTPLHFQPPPDDQGTGDGSISPPSLRPDDLRYQDECQEALRPHLNELIKKALDAKWELRAVAYALMALAARNMQERDEEEEPDSPEEVDGG
jgi:hypothetical protein